MSLDDSGILGIQLSCYPLTEAELRRTLGSIALMANLKSMSTTCLLLGFPLPSCTKHGLYSLPRLSVSAFQSSSPAAAASASSCCRDTLAGLVSCCNSLIPAWLSRANLLLLTAPFPCVCHCRWAGWGCCLSACRRACLPVFVLFLKQGPR